MKMRDLIDQIDTAHGTIESLEKRNKNLDRIITDWKSKEICHENIKTLSYCTDLKYFPGPSNKKNYMVSYLLFKTYSFAFTSS